VPFFLKDGEINFNLRMWDIIKTILGSPAGSFGFVAAFLFLVFFLVFRAGKIVEKFSTVLKLESNIEAIKLDMMEIKAFISVYRQENNRFSQRNSPISLSEAGNIVASSIEAEKIVNRCWAQLEKEIKSEIEHSSNPYTIQDSCFSIGKHFIDFLNDTELDLIKKYAYQEGHNIVNYDLVFGILIRDKYFRENNINVSDIDKHDPNHEL
jgi:hypothetical protein